jgi:hypothetical protein
MDISADLPGDGEGREELGDDAAAERDEFITGSALAGE